jgi:hypothetical protein
MGFDYEDQAKAEVGKYVGSVIRTGLGLYSGWLIAHGAPAGDVLTLGTALGNVVAGVTVGGIVAAWSLIQKKFSTKKE